MQQRDPSLLRPGRRPCSLGICPDPVQTPNKSNYRSHSESNDFSAPFTELPIQRAGRLQWRCPGLTPRSAKTKHSQKHFHKEPRSFPGHSPFSCLLAIVTWFRRVLFTGRNAKQLTRSRPTHRSRAVNSYCKTGSLAITSAKKNGALLFFINTSTEHPRNL